MFCWWIQRRSRWSCSNASVERWDRFRVLGLLSYRYVFVWHGRISDIQRSKIIVSGELLYNGAEVLRICGYTLRRENMHHAHDRLQRSARFRYGSARAVDRDWIRRVSGSACRIRRSHGPSKNLDWIEIDQLATFRLIRLKYVAYNLNECVASLL